MWRGLPYEERYRNNESVQIQNEQEVMESVCNELSKYRTENVVVDTSGSLVYIDESVLRRLCDLTRCAYIVADKEQEAELYNDEVIFRRPLVWGRAYIPEKGESPEQAMRRCFPKLIAWRAHEYSRWATLSIPYYVLRHDDMTVDSFAHLIKGV